MCPFRDPIPKGNGLNVPEVPASAEVPRHDGLKTFSPSWTKVVQSIVGETQSAISARTLRMSSISKEFLISPWTELNSRSAHP